MYSGKSVHLPFDISFLLNIEALNYLGEIKGLCKSPGEKYMVASNTSAFGFRGIISLASTPHA